MGVKEFFETHKKGSFHSQLGVPKGEVIPLELLLRIQNAYIHLPVRWQKYGRGDMRLCRGYRNLSVWRYQRFRHGEQGFLLDSVEGYPMDEGKWMPEL